MSDFTPSELLRAQDTFLLNVCRWRQAMATRHPSWLIKLSELGVLHERKISYGGALTTALDRVHMRNSHHYEWLAADASLFVPTAEGRYRIVERSDAPEWAEAHEVWRSIDPLNRVMPLDSHDAGHLSRALNESDRRI